MRFEGGFMGAVNGMRADGTVRYVLGLGRERVRL